MNDLRYDFDTCPDRAGTGSLKWDRYKGRDVLPLWVADMDFTSPPEVVAALRARLDHGVFGYTIPHDEPVEAVLGYLQERHGYAVRADWLNFLPGMVPALTLCCHAFTEPGDSIMTASPVYPPILAAPGYTGRELVKVPLRLADGDLWALDFEAMESAGTARSSRG